MAQNFNEAYLNLACISAHELSGVYARKVLGIWNMDDMGEKIILSMKIRSNLDFKKFDIKDNISVAFEFVFDGKSYQVEISPSIFREMYKCQKEIFKQYQSRKQRFEIMENLKPDKSEVEFEFEEKENVKHKFGFGFLPNKAKSINYFYFNFSSCDFYRAFHDIEVFKKAMESVNDAIGG